MLAKNVLKMVSALNSKDIKELKSLFTPKGMTSRGYDIATLVSSYDTEELKSMLTPDEFSALERYSEFAELALGQFEEGLDKLRRVIEILRASCRAVDRQVYSKALLKLNELETALRED